MPVRPIKIPILGVDQFSKKFGAISKGLRQAGQKLSQTGANLTRNVTLPVVAAGAAILATAGGFESSMNQVGVLTNATAQEFDMLSMRARELGANTQFAASEAAEGMISLAMAGLEVEDVYKAIPGSLQLAAAAGIGLGQAADIATNIMTPFGKQAEDLTKINDALANTFTRTNTTMVELAEAMTFVAPIAGPMNITLNETSAALGLMSKSGLKASRAGTSLRGILSRLANPSKEAAEALAGLKIPKKDMIDAQGNVRSLTAVVKAFEKAGAGPAELLKIFGDRAGPGMAALVKEGSEALETLTEQTKIEGRAAEVAEARMKGLFGQLKKLKSAAQELAISIGEAGVLDAVTKLASKVTGFIQKLGKMDERFKKMIVLGALLAAALGPILLIAGKLAFALSFIWPIILKIGTAIAFITNPIGLVIAGFLAFIAIIKLTGRKVGETMSGVLVFINPLGAIAIWLITRWKRILPFFKLTIMSIIGLFKLLWTVVKPILDLLLEPLEAIGKALFFILDKGLGALERVAGRILPEELKEKIGLDIGRGATPAEAVGRAAGQVAAAGVTNTNNAEVLVRVESDKVPVRTERISGENLQLETDMGLAFLGGTP